MGYPQYLLRRIALLSIFPVFLLSAPALAVTSLDADFDGSGRVDFPDFLLFAQAFGSGQGKYDLDGDGGVAFADFVLFGQVFGQKAVLTFADPNLEQEVRSAIYKRTGDILPKDVADLTVLRADYDDIERLDGIEHLIHLEELYLNENRISDISVLSRLTSLKKLNINGNSIRDIAPLARLTSLTELDMRRNQIQDVSALSDLRSLKKLTMSSNPIGGISPLAGLAALRDLDLSATSVGDADISALSNLDSLRSLHLEFRSGQRFLGAVGPGFSGTPVFGSEPGPYHPHIRICFTDLSVA